MHRIGRHAGCHEHDSRARPAGWRARARRSSPRPRRTPLVPADFLDLFAPLRAGADLRGRIESVHPETADAATLVIRPGRRLGRPRARPVRPRSASTSTASACWRAYSLTHGPRADGRISITVKAVPDGQVSHHLVRDTPPRHAGPPRAGRGRVRAARSRCPRKLLFVTAGSGITPVIGMLRNLFPVDRQRRAPPGPQRAVRHRRVHVAPERARLDLPRRPAQALDAAGCDPPRRAVRRRARHPRPRRPRRARARPRRAHDVRLRPGRAARRARRPTTRSAGCRCSPSSSASRPLVAGEGGTVTFDQSGADGRVRRRPPDPRAGRGRRRPDAERLPDGHLLPAACCRCARASSATCAPASSPPPSPARPAPAASDPDLHQRGRRAVPPRPLRRRDDHDPEEARIGQVNPIAHLTAEDLELIGQGARRHPPVGHRHPRRARRALHPPGDQDPALARARQPRRAPRARCSRRPGSSAPPACRVAKILENMEIGHNILHGQWDWMRDPKIHSTTWEWDSATPADAVEARPQRAAPQLHQRDRQGQRPRLRHHARRRGPALAPDAPRPAAVELRQRAASSSTASRRTTSSCAARSRAARPRTRSSRREAQGRAWPRSAARSPRTTSCTRPCRW